MGTNYHFRFNLCDCCGRYDEAHVGKSGHIWRGYRHVPLNAEHPDWGYREESPFGFPIVAVADWRNVFASVPGELWDSYGRRVDGDPLAWLDSMDPYTEEDRKRAAQWWREDYNWYDRAGYRFSGGEFS